MKSATSLHKWIVAILLIYLLVPLAGTALYSLASQWDTTVLPQSLTLKWYAELFQDERFLQSLGRSLVLMTLSVGLSLLIMIPTLFLITVYFPQWERLMQALAILPFGIPPVVLAVGLLQIYSAGPLSLAGTPWILIGAYFILILPYMYQGIRNSLRTIGVMELIQAAQLLGASTMTAFVKVIIPNILPGIVVATSLSMATLFGEFALANLLVGGRFETVQIYLYQQFNKSGHLTSAIVITYYLLILLLTWIVFKASNRNNNPLRQPLAASKKWMITTFKQRPVHRLEE